MRINLPVTILSITLSILGLGQGTLAEPGDFAPWKKDKCPGGFAQSFRLGGEVNQPKKFNFLSLKNLAEDLKSQNPSVVTEVTVTFKTGTGSRTETYYGVPLWELINNEKAANGLQSGNSGSNSKNSFLRQYALIEATDCYGAVVAIGEIQPNFEGKAVLVAYGKKDSDGTVQPLSDEGFARLVVPGDQAGGRYVSNIRNILIFSAPASPLKLKSSY
ncbi:hypothetical protein [Calothrix sp. 336/3]|uniref:hypothetical protein n=1 Tax=Calothrix sp. 336/3 TaxID=1337936 RepID=UPI0004E32C34|nr:hypothetical protein [Calothrix sp. 336/3]AKG20063.1 hypothetical protein IJ00_00945 [Calothrix sp. 336/3]